jgi:hypothetical protein
MDSIRITFFSKRLSSIPIVEILPEIVYGLNAVPKTNSDLAPRDYIFCYRERCPYVETSKVQHYGNVKGKFQIGDEVLIKSPLPNPTKLEPRFLDGGRITEHIGHYTYTILKDDGRTVKYREDRLRLKPVSPGPPDAVPVDGGGLH